jgi:hypothetical protein
MFSMRMSVILLLITAVFGANSAAGHHFFATEYDRVSMTTIEAVVTAVYFQNPHVRLDLVVTTDGGEEQVWVANSVSPNALLTRGWSEDTLAVGDRVTIYGNLGSHASERVWIQTLTLENGDEIYPVGRLPELDEP